MLKELQLMARAIYIFFVVLTLAGVTGLGLSIGMLKIGVLIFANSFLFQYFVLHFAPKNIPNVRVRLFFLIGWWVFCSAGIAVSAMMMPHIQELGPHTNTEELLSKAAFWSSIFSAFGAAFVAMTCAIRAFTRYGMLD